LSDLLVIEFPSEAKAEGVREMLLAMHKECLIELGDAVVAVKDERGRVKLNQLFQPVAHGAVPGIPWSALIGLICMTPLAGAAVGAGGALRAQLADLSIDDDFLKQAARTLRSGNAALFLLIRETTSDKVCAGLRGAGTTVLRGSFDATKQEALEAALAGVRALSVKLQVEVLAGCREPNHANGELACCFSGGFTFSNFLADVLSIFIFVLWFWLLITVFGDLFRRHDLSGWAKVIWVIVLIIFPYFGVFIYLISQFRGMAERQSQRAQEARDQLRQVVGFSAADELEKLERLKNANTITAEEYQRLRARVVQ